MSESLESNKSDREKGNYYIPPERLRGPQNKVGSLPKDCIGCCKCCSLRMVGLGTNGVMIWDHTVVISLCSTNGGTHARPPTNYRWEFQTLNSVFLPAPFFIFLSPVSHISSLAQEADIEFVGRSSPIDLFLTRDIAFLALFCHHGMLHQTRAFTYHISFIYNMYFRSCSFEWKRLKCSRVPFLKFANQGSFFEECD